MEKNELPPPYSATAYPPPHLPTEMPLQMPMPGAPYLPPPEPGLYPPPPAPGMYPPPPPTSVNEKMQTQPSSGEPPEPAPYPQQQYTTIITQPPPITHVHVITPTTGTGSCPVCHTGNFATAYTTCGWVCGILCCPCGTICCLCCMKQKKCNHCGYTVA